MHDRRNHIYDSSRNPSQTSRFTLRANELFWQRYFRAKIRALFARITRQSREIDLLADVTRGKGYRLVEVHQGDAVRLESIAGSEGRVDEYDCDFLPRHRRDKQRWVGVCVSMMKDHTQLPPIDVINVNGRYYVKDGHHRVSVAKALGYLFLDANIAVWKQENENDLS